MMSAIAASLLQEESSNPLVAFTGGAFVALYLLLIVLVIVGLWKLFEKAGQPGWASVIPIYNLYILMKIVGRPWWWLLLCLIPFVQIVFGIIVAVDLAKAFGQSAVFGVVMLFFLGFIGLPMLGFGNYRYLGPPNVLQP